MQRGSYQPRGPRGFLSFSLPLAVCQKLDELAYLHRITKTALLRAALERYFLLLEAEPVATVVSESEAKEEMREEVIA